MRTISLLLRLLSLACWFLPFCFYMSMCVGGSYKTAYNKKDAFEYYHAANRETAAEIIKQWEVIKHGANDSNRSFKIDSIRERSFNRLYEPFNKEGAEYNASDSTHKFWEPIVHNIILPNYYSLSGVGILVEFKNSLGKFLAIASLMLTFSSLLFSRFLWGKKIIYLLLINLLLLIAFIINALTIHVDLLYGFWMVFSLVTVQIMLEIKRHINSPPPEKS